MEKDGATTMAPSCVFLKPDEEAGHVLKPDEEAGHILKPDGDNDGESFKV
jgi:hypothetical protein